MGYTVKYTPTSEKVPEDYTVQAVGVLGTEQGGRGSDVFCTPPATSHGATTLKQSELRGQFSDLSEPTYDLVRMAAHLS